MPLVPEYTVAAVEQHPEVESSIPVAALHDARDLRTLPPLGGDEELHALHQEMLVMPEEAAARQTQDSAAARVASRQISIEENVPLSAYLPLKKQYQAK